MRPARRPVNPRLRIRAGGVGRITFRDPDRRQNVLTQAALADLGAALDEAEQAARAHDLRALLIASDLPGSFIAGADIGAIAAIPDREAAVEASRAGQTLFGRIAALSVPTLAGISGACLGGGAELALACDLRVADDDERTRIGFPEVRLGILPAWGGTSRLPEIVGLSAALGLMLSGKPVGAARARRMGLVDDVLPRQGFAERCQALAQALAEAQQGPEGSARIGLPRPRDGTGDTGDTRTGRAKRLVARLLDGTPPGRALVVRAARRRVRRRTRGRYPAPLRLIRVVRESLGRPLARRLDLEADALGDLAVSPESRNLVFLFRLGEAARKTPPGPDAQRLAVIGAGPMGGGIAQAAAYNGIPVHMKDVRREAVAAGLAAARSVFDGAVRRGSLRAGEAERRMALISGGLDYAGVRTADVVIEAVVEKMAVKRAVLREVEAVVGPDAVIASNTSSLSIDAMAADLERPERFAGMHFFNPVHRMPLVEVVRGSRTDEAALAALARLAARLGKVPVTVADAPGFLVNRILAPCLNEAGHLLTEGWDARAVDAAWQDFGMPMGPFRLIDEIGIDVMHHAGRAMADAFGERMAYAPALAALAASGRAGRKGGLGFYRYGRSGRRRSEGVFDPQAYAVMGLPRARRRPRPAEVQDRLLAVMINEAARVLEEGVAASAADVDLAMVMGTGFPPFRGGLLRLADARGAGAVLESLQAMRSRLGDRFQPAPLLLELAVAGAGFHEAHPRAGAPAS